jgi:hypothetical protein
MAPRINWASFGAKAKFDLVLSQNSYSNEDFATLNPESKKKLVLDVLKSVQRQTQDVMELNVKFVRLTHHLEIDDRANSVRLISELLLLISTRFEDRNLREISVFLTSLQRNL